MIHRVATRRRQLTAIAIAIQAVLVAVLVDAQAASRNFIWRVSDKQNAIYLVGSIHMLTKDYYPLNPALDAAFKSSDLLVEEADLGEMLGADAQFSVLLRGKLPADQSLDKVLSPATYAQVSKHVTDHGLPMELMKQFKPWMLALMLETAEWEKAGFDPNLGLDKHFYDRAQTDGKPVQGLETADYQISLFDGMTAEQQDRLLADTLKEIQTEMSNVTKLTDAWKSGDAPTVERIVLADLKQDPVMYRRLLVERNQAWLPKLEALFGRTGHAFVVVGAAHLVGPDGLLAMLRSKGYSVEQL
jgi:uncharacterized protein YbaP (TraB family)